MAKAATTPPAPPKPSPGEMFIMQTNVASYSKGQTVTRADIEKFGSVDDWLNIGSVIRLSESPDVLAEQQAASKAAAAVALKAAQDKAAADRIIADEAKSKADAEKAEADRLAAEQAKP